MPFDSLARSPVLLGNKRNSQHHPIGTPTRLRQSSRGSVTPTILRKRFAKWTANPAEFSGPPASLARQRPGRARGERLLSLRDPDDFPNQRTHVATATPENRRGQPRSQTEVWEPRKSVISWSTRDNPVGGRRGGIATKEAVCGTALRGFELRHGNIGHPAQNLRVRKGLRRLRRETNVS